MTDRAGREQGFALVTVLWATMILGLLASAMMAASRTDTRVDRTAIVQAKLRAAADGVTRLVELRLLGPAAGGLPIDGTPFTMTYAGIQAQVTLQDQGGLVDLNAASGDMLTRLLMLVGGLDQPGAEMLTDRILDWREHGAGRRLNGAKAADYATAGYAYGPRQGPFETVAELKLVMGMTSALYERIAPALTVYAQKAVIDPEVAPASVLSVLPGMDAETVSQVLAIRVRRHAEQAPDVAQVSATAGRAVSIAIKAIGAADISIWSQTVVRFTDDPEAPMWIQSVG